MKRFVKTAGRGGGKTHWLIEKCLDDCRDPNANVEILSPHRYDILTKAVAKQAEARDQEISHVVGPEVAFVNGARITVREFPRLDKPIAERPTFRVMDDADALLMQVDLMTFDAGRIKPSTCTIRGCDLAIPMWDDGSLCGFHKRPVLHMDVRGPSTWTYNTYQTGRDRAKRSQHMWSDQVDSMRQAMNWLPRDLLWAPPPSPALQTILVKVNNEYRNRHDAAELVDERIRERMAAERSRIIKSRINRMLNHSSQALRLVVAGHPKALINAAKGAAAAEEAMLLHDLGFTDADPS